MKIVLDGIAFSLQSKGGVTMYFSQILRAIKRISPVTLINDFNSNNIYHQGSEGSVSSLRLVLLRYGHNNYKSTEKYIFHSSYFCVSKNKKAINVLTIHDCMYEIYYPVLKKKLHIWQKKRALKRSAGIICVSENTKKDLYKFYPEIKGKDIKVIHHGLSSDFHPLPEIPKEKIILYVSGRKFYKRFGLVVESMVKLVDYRLVIVGGGSLEDDELAALACIDSRYTHLTNLSNSELNAIYNRSHCLVYTSSYEGFGLPLLESIGAGCPVICENNSSLSEVVGNDYALLVSELTTNIVYNKVLALEEDSFRAKVVDQGVKFAKNFCWDDKARQLYEFYETMYKKY